MFLEIFGVFCGILLYKIFYNLIHFGFKYDSTDDKLNGDRSGLCVYVDNKTGVQYVGTMLGGLTPRVGVNGKIMTVKDDI